MFDIFIWKNVQQVYKKYSMLIQKTIKLIVEEQIMRKMRRKMFSVCLKYFNVY